MDILDELELVPAEHRQEVENEYKTQKNYEEAVRTLEYRSITTSASENSKKLVYVTFYTHSDKKVVQMYLSETHALEQVSGKAAELLPTIQWRVFSGTQNQADFEFTSSHQVWNSIKRTPICKFYYLLVHLERLHPVRFDDQEANCDVCHQKIFGHRYKCTECADFDICQKCEAKSLHPEHAMLRIVRKGTTRIPNYITSNAPRYVFPSVY
ncbi:hypothetical protein GCK72_019672 [Caenorhabditis remanei]|uniref:ZZ-type domain-containing protein n=1 Tax=Caenorhabditis remanei TaxID=31234 RepID=A0A6A5GEI8_CAERE|nr:hypothetical protein GCK72_019672 [Caenorhabditis remanei]KAF1753116.1 hypothetical protein GCK72_019672 [Caenorhabditis remanei]